MEHWSEIRTALLVGRLGTVRAAAGALGMHRSTVSRHVDLLEDSLGIRLFIRHREGYTLTDEGREMLAVARHADELFSKFAKTVASEQALRGKLTLSAPSSAARILAPALRVFTEMNPDVRVDFETASYLAKLEKREAHIALQVGTRPNHPDYVVIRLKSFEVGLYGSVPYFNRFAPPMRFDDLLRHRFVGCFGMDSPVPLEREISSRVAPDQVVLTTCDADVILESVLYGLGLGVVAKRDAERWPDLVEVTVAEPWITEAWLVTHVDVCRSRLVREFINCAKAVLTDADC